jgi:hypothetical protein
MARVSIAPCLGRGWPPEHQDRATIGEAFRWTRRPLIVIPGLDPGIPAHSDYGDPRIKSGDDEERALRPTNLSYAHPLVPLPKWPTLVRGLACPATENGLRP